MNLTAPAALFLSAAVALAAVPAAAQEIEGVAEVRTGNEIGVGDNTIRMYGSIAPGPDELCEYGLRRFRCGVIAWAELIRLVDGHRVSCDIENKRAADGAVYATCYVGERDINEALVRSGWAEAAPDVDRYRTDQEDARRARRGVWAGRIKPPDRRQAP